MQLRKHQAENRDRLVEALKNHRAAIDASDTGVGKTYTALATVKALGAQPAIICPLAVVPAWTRVAKEFGLNPVFVANYERCRTEGFPFSTTTKVRKGSTTVSNFKWGDLGPRTIPVFDEVQRCRGQNSLNSQMLLELARKVPTLMLSATPFTTPLEAYAIGYTLGLFSIRTYFNWLLKHGVRKTPFGSLEFKGGAAEMDAIHHSIFPSKGVRTRHADIPDFPKTVVSTDAVETGEAGEIQKMYLAELEQRKQADKEKMIEKATQERAGDLPQEFIDSIEPLAITADLRARQEIELRKCSVIAEMARDANMRGDRVAIFVNFDASVEVLRKLLNTDACVRGTRKAGENHLVQHNHIVNFQRNHLPYILVNNQAGGAGVSLHDPVTQVPRTTIISPPWSAIVLKQVLGRTNRDGGGFSRQHIVFAADTMEERVMARVQDRLENLDALTDGDLDPFIA